MLEFKIGDTVVITSSNIDDEGELFPYFLERFRLATLLEKELAE